MFPFFPALLLLAFHSHLGPSLEGKSILWPAEALQAGWGAGAQHSPRLDVASLKLAVSVWEGIVRDSAPEPTSTAEPEPRPQEIRGEKPSSGHRQSGRTRDGP